MTNILAVVSGDTLIQAFIWLIVAGLIFWIVRWAITYIGVPEPFNKVLRVLLALVAAVVCINALLSIAGHGFIRW